ncbi:MAG: GNAT family N-acetyltransferase [Candidatus Promineifilaceae bacterium]|nr:GNAT family N-acetyltransferase [Candidatus Promineifilaceae bacterium]
MMKKENVYHFPSKSGQKIWVRPLRADDAPLLVDLFNHMTSESRYRRFHQTLDHVPTSRIWAEAKNIVDADPARNHGLVATADVPDEGNVPVGAVRIVETSPGEGEIAISIRDDFQNQGIGSHMMRLMTDKARALGYRRLIADIQNDNQAIWRVFNKLPYQVMRSARGSYSDIVIFLKT